ncbi:hypothetical protein [Massilia sp. CF038]|uniref:hypothetical protein n=1 Tax=Massilia sp. CF038 TaxID=1881045 RepID=UPI00091BEC97|nr:hypothetical protein [Massilia sp. CF038]SHH29018.1 hypothetical protein SAMN05428948_3693 [Massilia sp. CF038]
MKFEGKKLAQALNRLIVLFVLLIVGFCANAYASMYFSAWFFTPAAPRPYGEMISAAVVGALAAATLVTLPMVKVYGRGAWVAALAISSPIIYLRGHELIYFFDKNQPRIMTMSALELLIYPSLLLVGVWITSPARQAR